ncbi:MAG: cadherin domain-containing protein, partial [Planctomycetaceae bacterium]
MTTTTQNQNHAWNHLGNAVLKLFTFSTSAGTAGTRTFKYDIGDTNGNINGSSTATQAMTVNGNAAPTDITLTPATVAENLAAGTVVGTLAAVDTSTVGETATFTLVANANASLSADNSKFQIPVGSNQLQLAQALNFEAQSSYNITVRVTDSAGNPFTKALVVTATNVNEAPTAVALSNSSVAENAAIGTVVGTITGTDPDAGTNLSFTVEGTDLNRFEAFNNAGTWQLRTKEVFNFETDGPFSIAIRGSDGSLSFSQPFTIGVTNVNEAPTTISLNPTSLNENNVSNDVVGELNTDDADLPGTAQTFTYTIVGGDAGFNVWTDPVDGKQKLRTTNLFNYEAKSSYSVQLRSEDQGNLSTATQTFTILVTDVDEAPAWSVDAAQSVNENSQFVATLSASDPEGTAIVYSIRSDAGTDFSKFELRTNGTTGDIELWFK